MKTKPNTYVRFNRFPRRIVVPLSRLFFLRAVSGAFSMTGIQGIVHVYIYQEASLSMCVCVKPSFSSLFPISILIQLFKFSLSMIMRTRPRLWRQSELACQFARPAQSLRYRWKSYVYIHLYIHVFILFSSMYTLISLSIF